MLLGAYAEQEPTLYRPVGCRQCDEKGYRGRTPIMEILVMDADMDELVARRSTSKELRTAAMAKGFRPLAEAGMQRVLDGVTTLSELSRAVDLTGRYA
jgi:type II secretory ATPase GspE/PulE/Tfp pilus assembly ATPase PilB-like protein